MQKNPFFFIKRNAEYEYSTSSIGSYLWVSDTDIAIDPQLKDACHDTSMPR